MTQWYVLNSESYDVFQCGPAQVPNSKIQDSFLEIRIHLPFTLGGVNTSSDKVYLEENNMVPNNNWIPAGAFILQCTVAKGITFGKLSMSGSRLELGVEVTQL